MTLQVESPTVYTSQGVPISVTGIAQVLLFILVVEHVLIKYILVEFILVEYIL